MFTRIDPNRHTKESACRKSLSAGSRRNRGIWIGGNTPMINTILRFSVKQRLFIVMTAAGMIFLGIHAFKRLAIDVFPDPSPPLVQVFTEAEGMAPEEIETFISYPIESAMFGLPRITQIRSFSSFALSIVNIYFEDKTDIYWARQLVAQRLDEVSESLPDRVRHPSLGPIATGLGMVYLYYLEGENYTTMELRTMQDWLVKYELKSVPEVSQILSQGGDIKQYQILTSPRDLLKYDLSLSEVIAKIRSNNQNAGAGFITRNKEEYVVRSVGLAQSIDDLENIVIASRRGTPVLLKDLATIETLPAIKRGTALINGEGERVVGQILKLYGANTANVIKDLERRINEINRSLPSGIRIVPFYNQASFINKCYTTVSTNLVVGIVLVILVLFLFMGDFPSAFVAMMSLPFSILFAFILMRRFNLAADIMSFGGLAISIGLIADAAIILVENTHRHIQSPGSSRESAIRAAGGEVIRPLFFAIGIIILVFLPIFTLTGVEGIMFRPMGFSISFALAGSLLFTMIFVPSLSYFLLRRKSGLAREPRLIRNIKRFYFPFFASCRRHRRRVFTITALVFISGLALVPFLGREYIPAYEEGTLHLQISLDPNTSLEETIRTATAIEKTLVKVPEVTGVLTRIGRGDVGGHAHFVNEANMLIQLNPLQKWKHFKNKNELIEAVETRLDRFPGLNINITQPIAHNLDNLISGVKAQLAIKLYGKDFDLLREHAVAIKDVIASIKGAADVQVEKFTGQNQIQVNLDRKRIARHGLNIQDIQELVETAIGGITLGKVYEGERYFDIFFRFRSEDREGIEEIGKLLVRLPEGGQIPLAQLARIEEIQGPRVINRENNKRFITIQANVRGRDIGRFVEDAKRRISRGISLPPEYFLKWGGQFELQQRAARRLGIITPLTLALVALLLFAIFHSFREVLIILINIPLALTGGIIALKLSGLYLSVPAAIGFIAIFGIALEDGLVLLSAFHRNLKQGHSIDEAIDLGVGAKLRPVLMTSFTTIFGVLPLLLAKGPGAEIQRPLAAVVIGGLLTSTAITLIVLPLVFQFIKPPGLTSHR